jgi:ferredoxin
MYSVEIDRSLCSGFGSCVDKAPGAFALGHDRLVEALVDETADAAAVEAAGSCPMGAIAVFRLDTGEQVA